MFQSFRPFAILPGWPLKKALGVIWFRAPWSKRETRDLTSIEILCVSLFCYSLHCFSSVSLALLRSPQPFPWNPALVRQLVSLVLGEEHVDSAGQTCEQRYRFQKMGEALIFFKFGELHHPSVAACQSLQFCVHMQAAQTSFWMTAAIPSSCYCPSDALKGTLSKSAHPPFIPARQPVRV